MIFNHYSLLGAIEQLCGWDAWRIRLGWPVWMGYVAEVVWVMGIAN